MFSCLGSSSLPLCNVDLCFQSYAKTGWTPLFIHTEWDKPLRSENRWDEDSSQKVFGWKFETHFNTVWPFWSELYLNPGRTHAHMENMQAPDREAPGWKSNQWPPNCEWCNAAFLDHVNVNARVHPAAATEIFSHNQMTITAQAWASDLTAEWQWNLFKRIRCEDFWQWICI